jgi:hypothetical protein
MQLLLRSAVATLLTVAWATPVFAAPVCLDTYRIQNTSVPDPHTIIFHMKDGSAWRNTLRNACPDLKFWGFVYADRSGMNEICDNQTAVKVINSGELCLLGAFSKEAPHT